MIKRGIPKDEREAFFRDIRIHEQDLFIRYIVQKK